MAENADALDGAFEEHFAGGVNVVLDYLWGKSAERLLIAGAKAGKEGLPIRFVQIGNASGANITLPAAAMRSAADRARWEAGSAASRSIASSEAVEELLQAAGGTAGFDIGGQRPFPCPDVGAKRGRATLCIPRIVFTIGENAG